MLGLAAALLLAGCSANRTVLSNDQLKKREVAVLSGEKPAQPPPSSAFQHLTPLQVEASLRHVTVRPASFIARNLGEPEPLLNPEQVAWARAAVLAHLPQLRPDQRLELRFRDRFNHYPVVVELYGSGTELVYRFTELALAPKDPIMTSDLSQRLSWAKLVGLPGQKVREDGDVSYLRDPIFAGPRPGQQIDILSELRKQGKLRHLSDDELASIGKVLQQHPEVTPATLNLYLDKLQLVDKGEAEGLFTTDEAAARRKLLLQQFTPAAK